MTSEPTPIHPAAAQPQRATHTHVFDTGNPAAERGTRWVLGITLWVMVLEIAAGWWFNSMALMADGWHMSSHAVAIGLSVLAYAAARRHAQDPRFAFGTWKIEILAGYTSATALLGVAGLMVVGSLQSLISPQPIAYPHALGVAVFGLGINLVCVWILGSAHHTAHSHSHSHSHSHAHAHAHAQGEAQQQGQAHHHGHCAGESQHPAGEPSLNQGLASEIQAQAASAPSGPRDLNLHSAYVHVLADAATSVLAIAALLGGMLWGWAWLDPAMGIVGAIWVALWARGLIRETGRVLLDREMDHPLVNRVRERLSESGPTSHSGPPNQVLDLHLWRVGRNAWACAASVATHDPILCVQTLHDKLRTYPELAHVTIELHRCAGSSDDARALHWAPEVTRTPGRASGFT